MEIHILIGTRINKTFAFAKKQKRLEGFGMDPAGPHTQMKKLAY